MDRMSILKRAKGKYTRTLANYLHRRVVKINLEKPIITFTFDDAPLSALTTGSSILEEHNAKATFYMSLSLLGTHTEVGSIATRDDMLRSLSDGNELGCHTHGHLDAWEISDKEFVGSIIDNQLELDKIAPGAVFKSFAYPKSGPRFTLKKKLEKYFDCCRGGGQTYNADELDLNLLKAYFIDKRTNVDLSTIKKVIDDNASCQGWLIFATHDICDTPSLYGCSTEMFKQVVHYAAQSGALLLPVSEALEIVNPTKKTPLLQKSEGSKVKAASVKP